MQVNENWTELKTAIKNNWYFIVTNKDDLFANYEFRAAKGGSIAEEVDKGREVG